MIFTPTGHTFRISLELLSKVSHVEVLGTGYQIRRTAKSEQTSVLSNSDFHRKLQPLVPETDPIHEKLHCQTTLNSRVENNLLHKSKSYFLFLLLCFYLKAYSICFYFILKST